MELIKLKEKFISNEFRCDENLDLGPIRAFLYASRKKSLFYYPYFVHCYIFNCSGTLPVTIQQVVGYHALSCAHTDRFKNKRSRLFRIRIPITLSVLISESGFDDLATEEVTKKKQRNQMSNVNAIMLVDSSKKQYYNLRKVGLVGSLPLRYTNRLIEDIATTLNVNTNDTLQRN